MQRHPLFPHVVYKLTQKPGFVLIEANCTICGEELNWRCTGNAARLKWRLDTFANLHAHGTANPVQRPMPRGVGPRRNGMGW